MNFTTAKEIRDFLDNPRGKNLYIHFPSNETTLRIVNARRRGNKVEVKVLRGIGSFWFPVESYNKIYSN